MDGLVECRSSIKDWFRTAKRYIEYANSDGIYDEIKDYIKNKN